MNKPKQFSSNGIKTFSQHTEARTKLQPFPLVEAWVSEEAVWACYQEGKKALWESGPQMFPSWLPSAFPLHFWAMVVLGEVGMTGKSPTKNTFIVFACFYQHKFIPDKKIWVQILPFMSQSWSFEYSVHFNRIWEKMSDSWPTHSNYFSYFPTLLVTGGLNKEYALENFHLKQSDFQIVMEKEWDGMHILEGSLLWILQISAP